MEKYDLTDCSIIIPIEMDCKERLEHLHYQFVYFPRFFNNYELIVVEYGNERKIKSQDCLGIQYIFIKGEEPFSLSKLSNLGVSLVKNQFFYKCDTDVMIDPKALFLALETLKKHSDQAFVLPYNGVSFTISDPLRQQLMESFAFNRLPLVKPEEAQQFQFPCLSLKNKNSKGLIHLFNTALFKSVGGYNEEFVGWGFEDDEVVDRFSKLGYPPLLLEGYNVFHLNHPRKKVKKELMEKNFLLANALKKFSPEELKEYIKTWSRWYKR